MSHKLSKNIKFNGITKEQFNQLLDTMVKRDVQTKSGGEYKDEGRDGFEDLYNYWNELGSIRLQVRIDRNLELINEKK